MFNAYLLNLYFVAATRVYFEQENYVVNETSREVNLTLVLDNPSSNNIDVKIRNINISAHGMQSTILCL